MLTIRELTNLSRCHGRMCSEISLALLARLESLEQLSNQHDILLTTLGDIMEVLRNQEPSSGSIEET